MKISNSLPVGTNLNTTKVIPRVAVLLATFNGMSYLEEQIASIFAQIGFDLTVFISDDMSTDGSQDFIRGITDKKIVMLPEKKAGSAANNFFRLFCDADFENFDYVALSDQDDVWSPRKLQRSICKIEENECGGYSSDLLAFDDTVGKAWYLRKSEESRRLDYLFQGASAGCTYVLTRAAAILVREKIRPRIDSFPKDKSHDWLIYAICRSHGVGWYIDNQSNIFYRQHVDNAYGARSGYRGMIARWRLARSGWYRQHVAWLSMFLKNTDDEMAVMNAIKELGWRNRIWLASKSSEYRRRRRDRHLLALTFLSGVFH